VTDVSEVSAAFIIILMMVAVSTSETSTVHDQVDDKGSKRL
jgi:hypothetical protein